MPVRRRPLLALPLGLLTEWSSSAKPAPPLRISAVSNYAIGWVSAQLLPAIFKEAGLPLQILPLPNLRASKMATSGELDGELVRIASYGDSHPQLLRVEPPYYRVGVRAYSLAESHVQVHSGAELRPYSLGVIRGMAFADQLMAGHPAVTLCQDSLQMFKMLQAGRVTVALDTSVGAISSLQRIDFRNLVVSPELANFELYCYLHMRHKLLAPRIGEAIRHLKASGELDHLAAQAEARISASAIEHFTLEPGTVL